MSTLQVRCSGGSYAVHISDGAIATLGAQVQSCTSATRVLLVMDRAVATPHGEAAKAALLAAGLEVHETCIDASEATKTIDTATALWAHAQQAGLDRHDAVVALGGGVTGDVAGFVAATWLRGIAVVQVPTTALAMVDAAIGGKTGVNQPLPEALGGGLGKNLIGAFWPPAAVVADPLVLATLPSREIASGLAECVKHAMLSSDLDMSTVHHAGHAMLEGHLEGAAAMLQAVAAVKIGVVQADEHEAGQRAVLNLGHTFGHAIEGWPDAGLLHGEAVAIGLVAAGMLGIELGCFEQADLDAVTATLEALSLPVRVPEGVHADALVARMHLDKKVAAGALRLIVPVHGAGAEIRDDVTDEMIATIWRRLGAV
ncbi:MAG: 3-dehydroquinate synthase [Phycisphaerales bacterium]|nr:3-dehydroquinate synthase [Phycisphaerales bacterium]